MRAFLENDPKPHHVLVEMATYPEKRALKQALDDLTLAYSVLGHLPELLMLVLRPKGKFRISGEHEIRSELGMSRLEVRWRVVELWTLSAERFLVEADVGILPWVPLMQMKSPPEAILEQCAGRIEREAPPRQQGDMLAVAEVMTGLRFSDPDFLTIFQRERTMIESPVVKRWKAESLHEAILDVLKDRFHSTPRDVTKPLRAILDEKKLRQLNIVAAKCADLDAFRQAIQS